MGLFGKNKNRSEDELQDLSFFYKGEWDAITRFLKMVDYSEMKPDNTYRALLLSGQKRYLNSKEFTRKELLAWLVEMDRDIRSMLSPGSKVPPPVMVFLQELKLTKQHIDREMNVETFVIDGSNVAIRDRTTKKVIDL